MEKRLSVDRIEITARCVKCRTTHKVKIMDAFEIQFVPRIYESHMINDYWAVDEGGNWFCPACKWELE